MGALTRVLGQSAKFRSYRFEQNEQSQILFLPVSDEDLAAASTDQFLDALPVALARVAADGALLYVNDSAQNLLGDDATKGANLNELLEGLGRPMEERIKDMMQGRAHMRRVEDFGSAVCAKSEDAGCRAACRWRGA